MFFRKILKFQQHTNSAATKKLYLWFSLGEICRRYILPRKRRTFSNSSFKVRKKKQN